MGKYIPGGPARYEHQVRALQHVIDTRVVSALLMEPGTGKTAVGIDISCILAMLSPNHEARVLVVAPKVATDTWVKQAPVFASPDVSVWAEALGGTRLQKADTLASRGGKPYAKSGASPDAPRGLNVSRALALSCRDRDESVIPDRNLGPDALSGPRVIFTVVNFELLSSRAEVGSKTMADVVLDAVKRYAPDLVIVDESHKIKSPSGNASTLLARIAEIAPRRMILTGTVQPHSPLDIYAQWRFLQPYAFGSYYKGEQKKATYGGFKRKYAVMGGWMGKEVVGYQRLDEMHDIMSRNAIVVRKRDALDLPDTMDIEVPVILSSAEERAYDEMLNKLAVQLQDGLASTDNRLTQMLRLRQITAGHLPTDEGGMTHIGSSKAETCASLVHDTLEGESRVVVFAYFREEVQQLVAALKEPGTEVLTITGDTKDAERIAIRERFGSEDPARLVLVAQIKTISLAVNELVTARHMIFCTLSQQRDDYIQARDRLDRIGQKRDMTFWHLMAPETVDEVVLASHRDRTDLENNLMEHIKGRANRK